MRTTITNHGLGIYSLDVWDLDGQHIIRIDGLTSMAECHAEAARIRAERSTR